MIQRKNFARLQECFDIPNLVEVQTASYEEFLQLDVPKTKREPRGLQEVFLEVFPIESYDGNNKLEFVTYSFGKPKYNIDECQKRGMTYAAPLKVKLRLRTKKDVREQEVYMGDLPLMTEIGTFIINGEERVVVSQLHRSPGVSFEETIHPNGKRLYSARIIPYRGAWVEFEFDLSDICYVLIDRRRKLVATTFLKALGYSSDEDILKDFCNIEEVKETGSSALKSKIGRTLAADVEDVETGFGLAKRFETVTPELIEKIQNHKVKSLSLLGKSLPEIENTLRKDHLKSKDDALVDIYRKLRPGDPPTLESARSLLNRLFIDPRRYNLGRVGRYVLNRKLGMKVPLDRSTLDLATVVAVMKYLIALKNGEGQVDDIDHLGNRRVRSIGELLQNQFQIGLARVEKSAKERMSIYDLENMMPHNLINSKLVSSVIRDFFGRSQLSQFMDQTNPLAELTHKRRLSALGPGGLSRERAGFEVRDVHHSHYGRICPIETPEGPNIGLIASLSTYARVNEFGFLETPYRKVIDGRATNQIEFLTADKEDQAVIAQANAVLDKKGYFLDPLISCRHRGNFPKVPKEKVDYMDVSPKQLVSIAASLIPFLEHDDANRALMGSNMQRQAVPLLQTESPLIGTGMEYRIAKDSGAMVVAKNSGVVSSVQGDEIVIGSATYPLKKFMRSNANTAINQRPIVTLGERVETGDVIADGAATKNGELALGRNILVAFMPWRGYNFEDAILISEKLVKEDTFTSIHIEEFEIEARDTRLGNEEITRDIPNVGEDALKDLDEGGMIRVGAEVKAGDILVGKVTPKSETELSPEEKLLRAIFGEKAGDVRDASLYVRPGVEGIVVSTKVFSRKEARPRSREEAKKEQAQIEEVRKLYGGQIGVIKKEKLGKLAKLILGKKLPQPLLDEDSGAVLISAGRTIRRADIEKLEGCDFQDIKVPDNPKIEDEIKKVCLIYDDRINELAYEEEREIDKIKRGDELPPGVIKRVVVHVASKKKISVGDKMAGRHGNKGVIAKILPEEDLPFLPDGSPVEVVLNPLGVPSRMNVGQILETHLGWAAKVLGFYVSTSVFDGAREGQIKEQLKAAGLPENGKIPLYDGYTGEPFDQKVAVGYIYMMKLGHLVDDKIHARSIGPYSLVTQQPLGGKAQSGGQRFGEMEVWALEAYGAAYTLQELLTVKSDDVIGRTRIYESIVKGENALQPGVPESFNVLIKELQSLGLDVILEKKRQPETAKARAAKKL
ncbi:MAG: DNA-directed RNA polymerase subunit beta [Candidatus Omnitrophica bacterium]|nr:DNA-directed RNA polymerase subunit beta [Candidatus Omnitrophota bacterium]